MASSHLVDDEDDTDICPVCDGQCTCRELSLKYQSTPPTPTPAPTPVPSLKIKFTLPPSLIAKRRLEQTTSTSVQDAYTTPLKKHGCPTKLSLFNLKSASPIKAKINKLKKNLKARAAFPKKVVKPKRVALQSDHIKCPPTTHLNSDWVIGPRQTSVAGSDAEQMDIDTTGDESENQCDQDQDVDQDDEDDEDEDEPDEDNDEETRRRYVGFATGWSEEDESSFDADLFFANLSSSSSSCGSSTTSTRRRRRSYSTPGGIDEPTSSPTRTTLETLPFEVTENWDGQLTFTNGQEAENRGIVDINFEKDAERFIIDSDADDNDGSSSASSCGPYHLNRYVSSTAQLLKSSDINMSSISDTDAGYEEEDGGADEGDTTDEELVGDNCLPNERAMGLFALPLPISMAISAIDPMSTVSPSIGIHKRRHARRDREMDVDEDQAGASFSPSSSASFSSSHANYPRQTQISSTPRIGSFVPTGETRQAIIGNDNKGIDVPSPHPRFYGRKNRVSVVQYLLKKHLQQQSQSPLVTPSTTNSGSSPSIFSDTHHLISSSAASPLTGAEDLVSTTSTTNTDGYDTACPTELETDDDETACIVNLDDVLEASFLDYSMDRECEVSVGSFPTPTSGTNLDIDTSTAAITSSADSTPTPAASNKHLMRWDAISIGAFRHTREQQQQAWASGSRFSSAATDYGDVIKSSAGAGNPLSALLWQNSGSSSSTTAGSSKKMSSSIPTSRSSKSYSHSHSYPHPYSRSPTTTHKSRKELRREKNCSKRK